MTSETHGADEGQSLAAELEERRVRHTGLFGSGFNDEVEQSEQVDFKMVTFSLAGKEYGVDIMMVKEIAKFDEFTYVPNTPPFVSGVYNLRGDIISVIDLRKLFGLPVTEKPEGEPHEGLILRLSSGLIGVVVDSIDKVVGIASEKIQEPHPIFADVNIKYISGVVEHEDELYIILDTERVLGAGSTGSEQQAQREVEDESQESLIPAAESGPKRAEDVVAAAPVGRLQAIENLSETLAAVGGFFVSDLNRAWVESRAEEWGREHEGRVGISSEDECDSFLSPFFSMSVERLWNAVEVSEARELFSRFNGPVQGWNPGCREGYETYSLACVLRADHPDARIRIYASDNDLLQVSAASGLSFSSRTIPEFFQPFVIEGVNAFSFSEEVRTSIIFEFSDLAHATTVPAADVVLIRDVLSFMDPREQKRLLGLLDEQIKRPGVIITGRNEDLTTMMNCKDASTGSFRAFVVE